MIKWLEVSPPRFEKLCGELLELNGFENVKWLGKGGGDKGRDLIATKTESPLPNIRRLRRWIIQCKRYTAKTISKTDINAFLTSAREHKPDDVLIILTTTLTPDVRDWVESVRSDYRFDIHTWEERDLEREVAKWRPRLSVKPKIVANSRRPVCFYEMPSGGRRFMPAIGTKFEEVGFFLLNSYGSVDDKKILEEFVEYLRHNEIEFDVDEDDKSDRENAG